MVRSVNRRENQRYLVNRSISTAFAGVELSAPKSNNNQAGEKRAHCHLHRLDSIWHTVSGCRLSRILTLSVFGLFKSPTADSPHCC